MPGAEGAALAEATKVQGASCEGVACEANANAAAQGMPRATVKSCERYRGDNQRSMPFASITGAFHAGHRTPADPITRRRGGKLTGFTGEWARGREGEWANGRKGVRCGARFARMGERARGRGGEGACAAAREWARGRALRRDGAKGRGVRCEGATPIRPFALSPFRRSAGGCPFRWLVDHADELGEYVVDFIFEVRRGLRREVSAILSEFEPDERLARFPLRIG